MRESTVWNYRWELRDALVNALDDDAVKGLRKKVDNALLECTDHILADLKEDLAEWLAGHVHQCFERAFEAMCQGNESEFARWIHAEGFGFTGRDRNHPVIHGRLFETGPLELRKRLCEAHPEFLKNERIKDLEDQVRSLVDQVNELEARNRGLVDEISCYRR